MSLSINFKLSGGGSSFSLDNLEPSVTILALKALLKENTSIEPEHMKLIFKGRILKDTDTLESSKVESGQSMHIVKSAAANAAGGAAGTTPSATPAATTPGTAPEGAAPMLPPMGGMGAGGADPFAAMMQDPMAMQAMMGMMGGGATGGAGNPMANPMGGM